jgi:hypothetical protein
MCAPIIPGVNDSQMVTVLERAAAAGATWAGWVLLRLPGAVKQVFEDRIRAAMPLAADKILHRIRETRGGDKLYDARFGVRGRGEGPYADMIRRCSTPRSAPPPRPARAGGCAVRRGRRADDVPPREADAPAVAVLSVGRIAGRTRRG